MTGKNTIETLLKLGVHMKDAFTKFSNAGGKDWVDFLDSAEAKAAQEDVGTLLEQLTLEDIEKAVSEIQAREKSFLDGRRIADLSPQDLVQFHGLLDAENVLVLREVKRVGSLKFWQWLVDTALPTLITVARVVVPLLA